MKMDFEPGGAMEKEYWLRRRKSMCFAPITLSGGVILDEITDSLLPGLLLVGLFQEEDGECKVDIFEDFYHLFDDLEIPRTAVESSNIVSIGHDPRLSFLDVEFTGGDVYRYYGVKTCLFDELMEAESKGKFLNKKIKGHFPYTKMADVS